MTTFWFTDAVFGELYGPFASFEEAKAAMRFQTNSVFELPA